MDLPLVDYKFDYPHVELDSITLIHADCFAWLRQLPPNSIHAVVTDPPYGVKEYELEQLAKKENGKGGTWRLPPAFDGNSNRAPLPRFTALTPNEITALKQYFTEWSQLVNRVLVPGGHIFLASNAYLSQTVFNAVAEGGLEFRGEIIRLVRTMRGGDRPKNAEREYPDVCTLPRGCYEPWGLFRKPLPAKMTVGECLKTYKTGALRRQPNGLPFNDVINSTRTPSVERNIAKHPSIKPQALMRQLVYAVLPLGEGIVVDPFMGSGSTLAAAKALGYRALGIERHPDYFRMSLEAVPKLASLSAPTGNEQFSLFDD